MAERKYTHGLKLKSIDGVRVVHIGTMEIWDGADLSLIRDTLLHLIESEGAEAVGIDMSCVLHVPSGFFGMLFDRLEQGVEVRLYFPRERIRQMLWFRKFFAPVCPGVFRLHYGIGIREEEELWKPRPMQKLGSEFFLYIG